MNIIQQLNQKKQEALQATKMPHEDIKVSWFETAINALSLTSPMTLGISPRQFMELSYKGIHELTLMDFAILSNNLESKSAKDLDMTADAYIELLLAGEDAINTWQNIVSNLECTIREKLAAEHLAQKEKDKAVGGFVKMPGEA